MNIQKDDHFFLKVINLGFKKYGLERARINNFRSVIFIFMYYFIHRF